MGFTGTEDDQVSRQRELQVLSRGPQLDRVRAVVKAGAAAKGKQRVRISIEAPEN